MKAFLQAAGTVDIFDDAKNVGGKSHRFRQAILEYHNSLAGAGSFNLRCRSQILATIYFAFSGVISTSDIDTANVTKLVMIFYLFVISIHNLCQCFLHMWELFESSFFFFVFSFVFRV